MGGRIRSRRSPAHHARRSHGSAVGALRARAHEGLAFPHPRALAEIPMERRASQHLAAQMNMPTDWESRYRSGDMPWEKGAAHPALIAFLKSNPVHGRVLVPGCGLGHDVRALAATADEVVGLDLAPSAVRVAKAHPAVGGERYVRG